MMRGFDVALVLLAAPLWLPLAGLVALAVRVALGRRVLFRDVRAGLRGAPFTLFKFRTMREGTGTDAERLTRFGRLLRATSLDELPELWNVLKGEMSLVGPRPLPVRYLPRYTAEQARRHEVRPGLTGLAQVSGRNALGWEEKFRLDVAYVDSRTFAGDLAILAKTALQCLRPRGVSHPGEATMSEFCGRIGDAPLPPCRGSAASHPSIDIASQCSLRSGDMMPPSCAGSDSSCNCHKGGGE